tara:strand:+ start:131 stop:586 length:456 start_codon:yes stop_codon:yes gene_type:complete
MKGHIQNIINVCFAVSITAFIYQNDKQQDRIEILEGDTKNRWDVIVIEQLKLDINQLKEDRDKFQVAILENFDDINNLRENLKDNIDVNNNNIQVVKDVYIKKSTELANAINEVNKARLSVNDVKIIIESCKARRRFLDGAHDHDLLCSGR